MINREVPMAGVDGRRSEGVQRKMVGGRLASDGTHETRHGGLAPRSAQAVPRTESPEEHAVDALCWSG